MGGGTPSYSTYSPRYIQQPAGYEAGIRGSVDLGRGVAEAAAGTPPELMRADVPYLQETAKREAVINALNAMALEKEFTPETARMRTGLAKQLEQDFEGGPSRELSNMWLRQGLDDVIATGAQTKSGFARSALADKTRRDYFATRQGLQDRVAAYLQANPMPVAGLDPGSIAGIISQVSADNLNLRNAYKQQVLGYLGAQAGNVSNAFQQASQMQANLNATNTSAYNQAMAQNTQARNAAAAAGAANSGALMGAGVGAGGAIAGAALIAL